MILKNIAKLAVTSSCVLLIAASCSYQAPGRKVGMGPPAHAPAHGYRRKHVEGVELVFDTNRGVYVVIGYPDHYFHDGYFYRQTGGVWEMSMKIDSGWARTSGNPLPRGLMAKGNAPGRVKGKFHKTK